MALECTYLNFVYGDGTLYGGCSYSISEVEVLAKDTIRVITDSPVVVNDAFRDSGSYTVTTLDNSAILNVRAVLEPQDGSVQTTEILLHIDKMIPDVEYKVEVAQAVVDIRGYRAANYGTWTGRYTKADAQIGSFPSHYNMKPGSTIRAILQAFAISDDLIGGDLK